MAFSAILLIISVSAQMVCNINAAALANQVSGIARRWPTNLVSVKYPLTYTVTEDAVLRGAAQQVSIDLGYCVNFTNYVQGSNQPFLNVQPALTRPGSVTDICFTYPGYNPAAGTSGQAMVMFGSISGSTVGGCLDNQRDAMRFWVNSLGLLNEWERSDRDAFMTFPATVDRNSLVATTLQNKNLFAENHKLNSSVAIMTNGAYTSTFDLNSITMITGQRYAASSSQPVFTVANGGIVGQSARLSESDCRALKILYGCGEPGFGPTPTCGALSQTSGSVTLNPSPAILSRTIQCSTTTSTITLNNPMTLGLFWINGISYSATGPDPVITVTPSVTGVTAELVKLKGLAGLQGPLVIPPNTAVASGTTAGVTEGCAAADPCVYAVKFRLTAIPTKSMLNQQVSVNLVVTNAGVASTFAVSATLNLNCAPQFTSITAAEGIAASMVTQRTLTLSGGGITVSPPPVTVNPIQASHITAANTILAPFIVNYVASVFGQTGTPGTAPATTTQVNKVFVNCLVDKTFSVTNVLATITATDPDGGTISYYSFSGSPGAAATGTGEKVEVTKEGVLTISSYAAQSTNPTNVNAATAGAPGLDYATIREYYVVAVDSLGGQSVLRTQFYLMCAAPTIA